MKATTLEKKFLVHVKKQLGKMVMRQFLMNQLMVYHVKLHGTRKSPLRTLMKKNYISLPDTNLNVKNSRYQLIGGSSPASIGYYTFDPWLLKQAGISKELIRVEDYASDAVVLRLASLKTIEKMVALDSEYVGNAFVVIVSLLFLRMQSYAVNARTATWKERATMSFASLLWFTSFHTSGSTMMANKRNMLLETIAVMFLVARSVYVFFYIIPPVKERPCLNAPFSRR